jgi:4'-phosphopantetheinyl transferase
MIYLRETGQKDNRAAARGLLRHALREEHGVTDEPEFFYGPNGKPYLTAHPHIFFNLTHCRTGAACALSDRETGVDMQDIRAFSDRAARRVCTPSELEQLTAAPEPERLFCRLWAIKEAAVKLRGGSVLDGTVDTDAVKDGAFIYEGENFVLCCFGSDKLYFI